jgi:hypothetical protein
VCWWGVGKKDRIGGWKQDWIPGICLTKLDVGPWSSQGKIKIMTEILFSIISLSHMYLGQFKNRCY